MSWQKLKYWGTKQDLRCLKEDTLWRDNVLKIPSCHHISPCLHMGNAVPFLLQLPWQREMSQPRACSVQGQQDRLEPGKPGISRAAPALGRATVLWMWSLSRRGSASSAPSPQSHQSFSSALNIYF